MCVCVRVCVCVCVIGMYVCMYVRARIFVRMCKSLKERKLVVSICDRYFRVYLCITYAFFHRGNYTSTQNFILTLMPVIIPFIVGSPLETYVTTAWVRCLSLLLTTDLKIIVFFFFFFADCVS